jgi:hypothetical protein
MRGTAIPQQGSEFNDFLYATIYHDQEGTALSVLSALARQDLDPWVEAARLSQLPEETAVKQVTDLLAALPRQSSSDFDRVAVAARLCALLPRHAVFNSDTSVRPSPTEQKNPAKVFALDWRFLTIYLALMLLINWVISEFHVRPSPAATGPDSPSGVVEEAPNTRPTSDSGGNVGQNRDH